MTPAQRAEALRLIHEIGENAAPSIDEHGARTLLKALIREPVRQPLPTRPV